MKKRNAGLENVILTTSASGYVGELPILFPNLPRLFFSLLRIRREFKKCDIIHALDGFPYGVIAALASFGLGKKLIITAIGTGAIQALRHPLRGRLLHWAYRRADAVVAISDYTKHEILSRLPDLHITVINHAVDAGDFEKEEVLTREEEATIQKLKPYVLSVGGWKNRKGFEYSFAAFASMVAQFSELKHAVVGIGSKPHLAGPLGISDKVFYFKGIRWPFLKAIYKNAELFMLLPYNDRGDVEGFGFVFLEAAAAGLPVIGTRDSGAEDAVLDAKNGFLVEPKNAIAAAEAAIKILKNRDMQRKFRAASLEFAKEMNWVRVVEEYSTLHKKLFQ